MVYVASRKAAAMLGLHPQTLRRYANEGKIPHYCQRRRRSDPRSPIGTPLANAYTTSMPTCAEHPGFSLQYRVLLPGQFRPAAWGPRQASRR